MLWESWLTVLRWKLSFRRNDAHARKSRRQRLWPCPAERLETRQMLSAVPAVSDIHAVPLSIRASSGADPLSGGSSTPSGYTPTQIRHAYGVDSITFTGGTVTGDGSGTTIAIVDAYDDPNIATDLATFDSKYSLAAPTFTKVNQSGGTTYPSANSSWTPEIALDVEWAHAIAPKAGILLVEANSSSITDLLAGVQYAASVSGVVAVSMSFGAADFSGESFFDSDFLTPSGHTGVTFLAATGDTGAQADYPAMSPNVVAVGGTTLNLTGSNTISSETGWSGSGGGISAYESKPIFQNALVSQSSTFRTVPDVAWDANPNTGVPVCDSYAFGSSTPWAQFGGTSAASPQWAGVVAIADQGRIAGGQTALDGSTQLLPMLYSFTSSDFHDITSGTSTGSPTYAATSGYDLVTGRGSPAANLVVSSLLATPLTITKTTLSNWTQSQSGYSQTVSTSNGTSTLTFSLSGSLPNGLSLNSSTGVITGTPTKTGNTTFTIKVVDSIGEADTQSYTTTINAPVSITTTSLPTWTQSLSGYSQTISTSGGTTAFAYTLPTGTLPAGLSLNSSTGVISGTPTTATTSTFTIKLTDASGATTSKQYTVTVNSAVSISTSTLSNWTQSIAGYSKTVSASGGTSTLTYSLSAGSLPSGLSLNTTTGVISGTPTTAASSTFTVKAQDTLGATSTKQYTVTINAPVSITASTLSNWTQNASGYSKTVTTSGGTTSLTFSLLSGTLPGGLSLNSGTGVLSGTPTATGAATFTVEAADSVGSSATKQYTVTINAPLSITTAALSNWTQSIAGYSQTVATSGGTTSLTFSLLTGSLPSGLSLNTGNGAITGTPTTAASSTFTMKVVDAAGASATQQYTVTVNAPVSITTSSLANWTQNIAGYGQTVVTSGGTPSLTFSLSTGSLPAGLSLNTSTGAITGTPTATGAATFTVKARDAAGSSATKQYTVTINSPVSITTATLANWTQSIAGYSQTVATSGGSPSLTFSVLTGALPGGLSLNSGTGAITGTPTAAASSTLTLKVVDAAGASATQQYTVTINAPVSITATTLNNWTRSISGYSQTVATSGGTPSLTFSLLSGSLPGGLSLTAGSGAITGTPTATGTSTFTIKALDSVGSSATKQYTVTINAPVAITTATLLNWTQSIAGYSQTVATTGGTASLAFSVSSGTLPSGLSLNSSTGALTGAPSTSGGSTFTVQVQDAAGATATKQYTVTIAPPVAITTATLSNWTQSIGGYSQTVATTGGTPSLTFSLLSGSLPSGLSLNTGTGAITGTPNAVGTATFAIEVSDAVGASTVQTYTVTIAAPASITSVALPDWTQNQAGYNQTVATNGGTAPLAFSISAGTLPDGLSLDASLGAITGTPDVAGTSTFTVQVIDAAGASAAQAFTVNVNAPLSITTTSLPNATQNVPGYSQSITTTGGTNPLTFSVSSGTLPDGLSLDPSQGLITGTPDVAASSTFTIAVQDASGASATQQFTVTICATVSITATSLADWTQSQSGYSQTVATSGGGAPLAFSVLSGSLPSGLSLDPSAGVISGTPDTLGDSTFTIAVVDVLGSSDTHQYTVTINPSVSIDTTTLSDWTQNLAGYGQTVTTSGGTAPLNFSVASGTLPDGLNLDASTGAISGTPDLAESSTFTIQVQDAAGSTATQPFAVTINPALAISTTVLPGWTQNIAGYSQGVVATGGTGTLTFSVQSGALPDGLGLDSTTGTVSGTPDITGLSTFTIEVTDNLGATATQPYTLTINAPVAITTATLSNWTQNQAGYSQTVGTSDGTSPLAFSITAGTLPDGLNLDSSAGVISGTPDVTGTSTFTVSVEDAAGSTASHQYSVTINSPLSITTTALPNWTNGLTGYSQSLATNGGTASFTFSISAGTLPGGLSLNAATGTLSGTPTTTGTSTFTIQVLDVAGASAAQQFTVTVNAAVAISTATLPNWTQNIAGYNQTVAASGGTASLTYSVSSGTLPAGLSLNASTGVIAGTPTASGGTTFTISATDSLGDSAAKQYTVTINAPVAITTASLSNWTQSLTGYSQTVATSGGTSPSSFSVLTGTLPAGLSLNAGTGVIAGTPTATGTSTFTVKLSDSVGASTTKQFVVTIGAPVSISTASLANWTQSLPGYSQAVAASGGTGSLTYSVSTGSLPGGLSLNASTGIVSGTPTATGTATLTIKAQDTVGASATRQYTVAINAPVSITTAALANWTQSIAGYSQTVAGSGGTSAVTYSVLSGALPAGLSLNASTGAITGTPTATGPATFTIKGVDTVGSSATKQYMVTISAPVSITTASLSNWTQSLVGYSQSVSTTGGTSPLAFSVLTGTLPGGLSLNSGTGALTGTPTTTGTSTFTLKVSDSVGSSATKQFVVAISAPVSISTASLANWTRSVAGYSQTVTASGGTGSLTYSVSTGALPSGLSLNASTGAITGTPSSSGTATFTIKARDTVGASATHQYAVTINASVSITTSTLSNWTQSYAGYSQFVAASGGTNGLTYSVSSGTLPQGLSLNTSSGAITGTPGTVGSATFTIRALDTVGSSATRQYTVTINAPSTGAWSTIASATRTAISSATITFSAAVQNVSLNDFTLNGADVSTLTGVSLSVSGNAYTISGLAASDSTGNPNKTYTLAVAAGNNIKDLVGAPLSGAASVSWVMDTIAPTAAWTAVATPTKTAYDSVQVTFSEAVQALALSDLTLDGTKLNTLSGLSLSHSGNVYTLSGLSALTNTGNPNTPHTVAVASGNAVKDLAGNSLSGTPSVAWVMDTIAPTLTGIYRSSPTNQITNATSVTFLVKFSEAVTGVDTKLAADFTLTGSASSGGTFGTPATNNGGISWSIPVTGLSSTSNGTVQLNLAHNTGLADLAANAVSTTTLNGQSYSLDHIAPTLTSLNRLSPSSQHTSATSVTFLATFSEAVTGVDTNAAADFALSGTASSGAHTGTPTTSNGGLTWSIPVTGLSSTANGAVQLNLTHNTGIKDRAANALATSAQSGQSYTLDHTAPTLIGIYRSSPANQLTNVTSVTFLVKFSEAITGVDTNVAADFALSGAAIAGAKLGTPTSTNGGISWSIPISGISSTSNGTLQLNLTHNTGIKDLAANALATSTLSGQGFTLDHAAPKLSSLNRSSPASQSITATSVTFLATFSEAVTGVDTNRAADFALSGTAISGAQIGTPTTSNGGLSWAIPVTGLGSSANGTVQLNLTHNTGVKDLASNSLATSTFSGQSYTLDHTPPALTAIYRLSPSSQFTNATSVTFLAKFSEAVIGVETNVAANFALSGTASAGGKIGTPTTNNGGISWSIPVTGLSSTSNGTVQLNLTHNTGIKDLAANAMATSTLSGLVYTLDHTPPFSAWPSIAAYTNAAVNSVNLTFSESVQTVALSDITLNGVKLSALPGTTVSHSGNVYTIGGLSTYDALGSPNEVETLAVVGGNGIVDLAGNPLSGTPSVSWTMDTTAPVATWTSVASPTSTATDSVRVTFSEPVQNVSLASFTFNGTKISSLSGTVLTSFSGNAYVISGLSPFDSPAATSKAYTVALASGNAIRDLAGNAPSGTSSMSWTVNAAAPSLAPTAAATPALAAVSSALPAAVTSASIAENSPAAVASLALPTVGPATASPAALTASVSAGSTSSPASATFDASPATTAGEASTEGMSPRSGTIPTVAASTIETTSTGQLDDYWTWFANHLNSGMSAEFQS